MFYEPDFDVSDFGLFSVLQAPPLLPFNACITSTDITKAQYFAFVAGSCI